MREFLNGLTTGEFVTIGSLVALNLLFIGLHIATFLQTKKRDKGAGKL